MKISQLKAEIKNCIYEVLSEGNSTTTLDETLLREMASAYKVKDKEGFADAFAEFKKSKGDKYDKSALGIILKTLAKDGEVDFQDLAKELGKSDIASFNNVPIRKKLEGKDGEFTDFLTPISRKEKKAAAKPEDDKEPTTESLLQEMATAYRVKDKEGFMDALEKYKAGKGEKFSKTILAKILNALAEEGEVDYREMSKELNKPDLATFNNISTRAKLEDEGGEFSDFLEPIKKIEKKKDDTEKSSEEKPAAKMSMSKDDDDDDDDDLDIDDMKDDYYKDEEEDSFTFDREPSAKELAKTNAFLKSLEDIDDDDDEF
jgi:hypothetical protein